MRVSSVKRLLCQWMSNQSIFWLKKLRAQTTLHSRLMQPDTQATLPIHTNGSVQNCFCHKTQHFGTMKREESASICKQAFTRHRKTLKANEDFFCVVRNINPTREQWHRFQVRRGRVGKNSQMYLWPIDFFSKLNHSWVAHVPTITCADSEVTACGVVVYTQYWI